jgi:hypothetical protein
MSAVAPPPATLPRSDITWTPTLADNDTLPTCSIAGLMNSARMSALVRGQFDPTSTNDALLTFYAGLAGCADTTTAIAATDGLVLLDVLQRAESAGFACGEQAPLVPLFAAIDPRDPTAIRDAIFTRGVAYVGVTLHEADMNGPWTGGTTNAGPVIGGHCITLWRYDAATFGAATWGATVTCDEAWLMARIDEAYALNWTFPVAP